MEGHQLAARSLRTDAARAALPAVLAVALLAAAPASGGGAGQSLTDPAGDSTGAPDLRRVTVSDSAGIVTFRFTVTGVKLVPDTDANGTAVYTAVDADRNGKPDYLLVFGNARSNRETYWDILTLPGYKSMPESRAMSFVGSGDRYTFKVGSGDLGGTTEFDFTVLSALLDGRDGTPVVDEAPDAGHWSYSLTSVKPVIGAPTTWPVKPVAGRPLTVTLPVTRSDSGAGLTTATVSLDLALDGRTIAHSDRLRHGAASVRLTLPANAGGRVLTTRVVVTFAGHSVTRQSSVRVA